VKAKRRILLYGNSVILGAIAAGLRRGDQFDVTTLPNPPKEMQALDTVKADILLFDLEAPHMEPPFFLLKSNPELLLIGISPGINLVRVWNSRQLREMSMQGLLDLISNDANGALEGLVPRSPAPQVPNP
jgi:hypothetical protein